MNEHIWDPDLGFQKPFSNKKNQGFLGNWVIPQVGLIQHESGALGGVEKSGGSLKQNQTKG